MSKNVRHSKLSTKEEMQDAFLARHAGVEELLKKLTEHLVENHMDVDPDSVHWGHVGSMAHAHEVLEKLCKSFNITPDEK